MQKKIKHLKIRLNYFKVVFFSFLYNVRQIPNKFEIYQLFLQIRARLQTLAVEDTSFESMLTFA